MLTISIFPISFLSFSGKDVPRDGKLSCVDANDNGKIFCVWMPMIMGKYSVNGK